MAKELTKENKDVKVKKKKERKGLGIKKFFHEVVGEVKKLTFPTTRELVSYTLTVIGFIVVLAVVIYLLDLVFAEGLNLLSSI
jgi:preprotein translocase subunit SecE